MNDLLTVHQAAELLGVHYLTVIRRIHTGKIKATKFNRVFIIRREDIEVGK